MKSRLTTAVVGWLFLFGLITFAASMGKEEQQRIFDETTNATIELQLCNSVNRIRGESADCKKAETLATCTRAQKQAARFDYDATAQAGVEMCFSAYYEEYGPQSAYCDHTKRLMGHAEKANIDVSNNKAAYRNRCGS